MIRVSAWFRPLVLTLCVFAAAACSSDKEEYVERPVAELYNQAMDALEARQYVSAAKLFDEVERQHPYSNWATKAQLMAAYAHYQNTNYDDALVALDRFIQLHPSNRDTPYAYYLKGLCYYEQISDVKRDQKMTQQALKEFEELIARFPDSSYARDAKIKLDLTYDHLAGQMMQIGRYYQDQGDYLAAINRFQMVIDKYQKTTHAPEALHRLTECYLALGLTEDARRTASVLGYNFPGSEWYIDSYELVEQKRVRPESADTPWYQFWDSTPPMPTAEPLQAEKEKPWYKFW